MTREDEDTIDTLRRGMAVQTRDRRLDPGVAETAWNLAVTPRGRRRGTEALAVAACLITVVVIAATTLVLTRSGPGRSVGSPPAPSCAGALRTSLLPTWARDGFSADSYVQSHVTGHGDAIVGVLFVPLHSPPRPGQNNKILWVARDPGNGPLVIRATLGPSGDSVPGEAVRRVVPDGPGPSIIDLPRPGCWQLTLTWSGQRASVELPYGA